MCIFQCCAVSLSSNMITDMNLVDSSKYRDNVYVPNECLTVNELHEFREPETCLTSR